MSFQDDSSPDSTVEGQAFPWILEHLLAYPGTYEIPLRSMYTLNCTTQNHPQISNPASWTTIPGNAFPRPQTAIADEQHNMSTATAAAQLRANLMSHIAQLPSQPSSLPPSFITSFVSKCFPPELDQVDFPQALTALDYLRDLDIRRRREVLAALDKLGIERSDLGHKDKLARKYPGVLRWIVGIEEKERKVEALYTQVYLGLRRWTLINELSLVPFNKANCIAMLNTLYPPTSLSSSQFVSPTAQLTPQILATQRTGFFRYITAVEKNGNAVLSSLINQHKRPGDATGWPSLREALDNYLRMANDIINECYESTHVNSPTAASFTSVECDDEGRRKIDSGISFGSSRSSQRNSAQSHATRPSTSSSISTHSRQQSKDKPLPSPTEGDETITLKPVGSTLERIARELRKIRSRSNMRDESKSRPRMATTAVEDAPMKDAAESSAPAPPTKQRSLHLKRSLKNMRSNIALRESSGNSRPVSRDDGVANATNVPDWDADEMRRKRMIWDAQQKREGRRADYTEAEV